MSGVRARFRLDRPGFSLDVDLELPGRGVTGVFGPSGCGKTSLLRCVAGLERASRGHLSIDGEVWQDERSWLPTHRRPLGYVFQEPSLFPHLTVAGNLRFGERRSKALPRVLLARAIELLGLGPLLERRPESLSGGEKQRVAIARALATSPRLLLMDEPLAALDLPRRREILPYLERLHDELEMPVLYVSHAPDEVARLADHLVVLERGRALASGPLAETLTRLEPPLRPAEEPGSVVEATVAEFDPEWRLVRLDWSGGSLWTVDQGLPIGRRVRVRILARDVSLARDHPGRSSIQNVLPGRVDALGDDEHPGSALVRVRLGGAPILARLTRRAVATLALAPGDEVWVQVKSAALME